MNLNNNNEKIYLLWDDNTEPHIYHQLNDELYVSQFDDWQYSTFIDINEAIREYDCSYDLLDEFNNESEAPTNDNNLSFRINNILNNNLCDRDKLFLIESIMKGII